MSEYEDDDSSLGASDEVSKWLSRLEKSRHDDYMAKYEQRCRLIRAKYRYEGSAMVRDRKYQMLWSNIQTMQSAIYAKPPHAVVSRRFRDQDPVARAATEVMERAINFTFDAADFDTEFKMVRDDFLLYARGVARIYYEPEYETEDNENEEIEDAEDIKRERNGGANVARGIEGVSGADAGGRAGGIYGGSSENQSVGGAGGTSDLAGGDEVEGIGEPKLKFENVRIRFVQRMDFRHQPSRVWGECGWIAFRAFLTRKEVAKRFGDKIAKDIALDADPLEVEDERESRSGAHSSTPKAAVWEIWDKANNNVLWVSPGYPDTLESGAPYLDLDGFYPCPRPAYGTLTPDSLVPVPDSVFYQDQADEIDQLTARIGALSDALKLVGFYPAGPQGEGYPEVEKAMSPGFENKLIAVQSWSGFLEAGSGKGAPIVWLPIDMVATIIKECVELRKQLVEDVYQIIGISDIMRGATDPQETEGAQQLKAQSGATRMRDRQNEIARFCRDIARLTGQVIAQYCSPKTIMEMTNVKLPTRAQQMIAQLMAQQQQMAQQQMQANQLRQGQGQQMLNAPAGAPQMPRFIGGAR